MTIPIRGTAALVVAVAIVAATAIWLPAYRWFLLISIGIGAAVAGGLFCGTSCVRRAMMMSRISGRWGWGKKHVGTGSRAMRKKRYPSARFDWVSERFARPASGLTRQSHKHTSTKTGLTCSASRRTVTAVIAEHSRGGEALLGECRNFAGLNSVLRI